MKKTVWLTMVSAMFLLLASIDVKACTGIRLIAKDGGVTYGRTMEWGTFDLHSRVAIIPRGYTFVGLTPDGNIGKKYTAKYGVVGLDMVYKDLIADGMNEKGLAIGLFYHPGFAEYQPYEKSVAESCISSQEFTNYILTQYANVDEVRKGLQEIKVIGVNEASIGIPVLGHWMVTDATGESIVIEYTSGEVKIYDAPLGVITNSPNYDWHLINIRNYVNLSMYSVPDKELSGLKFAPTGAGSGLLGLPGDNTPPSRFIRAVAWTQMARPLENATEAVYETFRILDNFQLPLGPDAAEGHGDTKNKDLMRSSTIWTSTWNLSDLTLNYHTQHNRRVRQVDLKEIDFSKMGKEVVHIPLDEKKEQDLLKVKPKL